MLPRKCWTRDVEVFGRVDPNTCAKEFNDILHCTVGTKRVIPLYENFCLLEKKGTTVNKRLFKIDGLHPNRVGSEFLQSLITLRVYDGETPPRLVRSAKQDTTTRNLKCNAHDKVIFLSPPAAPSLSDLTTFPPLAGKAKISLTSPQLQNYSGALLKAVPTEVHPPTVSNSNYYKANSGKNG